MTDKQKPLVSIITVSFRGGEMLKRCLNSIDKQDYPHTEIIVVDNGSGLNIKDALGERSDKYRWVTEKKNLGFAGGSNRGIESASGNIIALINDDAVLNETWVSEMVDCMTANPKAGAAAGLVIDGNNPAILDSYGVGVSLDGMSRQLECGESACKDRTMKHVLAFSGCSCALRREAVKESGLFDEKFFAYCEDTDLSLRLLRAGWEIIACSTAKSLHYYSHTGGSFSQKKLYLIERNHLWVAFKNFPLIILFFFPLLSIWRFMVQLFGACTRRGPVRGFFSNGFFVVMLTILKADLAALACIPGILYRRAISRSSKKNNSASFTLLLLRQSMPISRVLLSGSCIPANSNPHGIARN